jgi:oxygen-dependent protoporphyrinogen oxidase
MDKKVSIIGGGITGLTIAFYLKKAGIPFHIFEKEKRIGGVIKTQEKDGFLFEKGPNSGVLSNIEVIFLIEDLNLENKLEIADATAKKRLIWKKEKWHALPAGILSAVNTPLFTLQDKFRVLGEPFRKKGNKPDETLAEMVKRRLGKSFLDYAIDPFISGIYAGNPNYLVPKYALPKLYNLEQEYGSFIKGAIAKKKLPKTDDDKKVTKEIFSFKGGLETLVKTLEQRIGQENISLNSSNLAISKKGNNYLINNREFTDVISTVNAQNLSKIFSFISPEEISAIGNLQYANVIELNIGFNKWQGMDIQAFGGLVPMKEKKNILGALFMSSTFSERAPKGGALFTLFAGGTQRTDIPKKNDDEIKKIVAEDFQTMMGLNKFTPDLFELTRYPIAIAQYGKDSKNRLENISQIEQKHRGIHLAGSIRDGVGLADRVKQATELAKKIIEE